MLAREALLVDVYRRRNVAKGFTKKMPMHKKKRCARD
jgi:hypothetical protein